MDPQGKLAVVTGAAGGIGSALVRALVAAGADLVVATDVSTDGIEAGDRVVARPLDVGDEAATVALVEVIAAEHGPIDLWFANAGVTGGGGADAPDAAWERQWRVNVMAHVFAARALLPGWIARGEGHLVTTASMAGILTSLGDGVYAATKHAAVGFAEWLAITHGDEGVKVSCICPGAVDTAMLRAGGAGDAARATASISGGEVMAPDEAATRVIDAVREDRFLIFTHPEMHEYTRRKTEDPDRWIRGMTRLWSRSRELLAD
ncbi:MAG: SDR family oxidoreductase [Acidimicrobiia bacterium]|nr:SDR family oxidoreductase [Acidimicrobiia bacterium]